MGKILTIISREYTSRVKSWAFIISTFISPILIGLVILVPILAAEKVEKEKIIVYVSDAEAQGMAWDYLKDKSDPFIVFLPASESDEYYRDSLGDEEALLWVPSTFIDKENVLLSLKTNHTLGLGTFKDVERKVLDAVRQFRMDRAGVTPDVREKMAVKPELKQDAFSGKEAIASAAVASAIGYFMGFVIYMMLVIYGFSVMRGVVEEKSSRIAEVILSSVKPFELMMGKILGIGAVGLTQFLLWVVMMMGISLGLGIFLATNPELISGVGGSTQPDPETIRTQTEILEQVMLVLNLKTILLFIYYFLGGYLLFGSLFAAVGSAVDQESDSQQLTWPVMIPLILPTMLMGNIIQNPSGALAKFFSIFPLFSPTTMMVRYASKEPPLGELLLSMFLLALAFLGGVWLAARIYRVGILMYGKKVSPLEIWKWIRHY